MTSPLKILVVEDELLIAEDLKSKLQRLNYDVLEVLPSGEETLTYLKKEVPDVAVLDIDLQGEMNGMELGGYLRKTYGIQIIYLTQFNDVQTFERAKASKPSAYLTKPVNIWDLVRAIELSIANDAIATQKQPEGPSYLLQQALYLKNRDQQFERVEVKDILFLKASGAYTEVHIDGKKFLFSDNLSHFEKALTYPHLVRVHRSWIINIERVKLIDEMFLFIGEEKIPVGKTYKKLVKQYFKMI